MSNRNSNGHLTAKNLRKHESGENQLLLSSSSLPSSITSSQERRDSPTSRPSQPLDDSTVSHSSHYTAASKASGASSRRSVRSSVSSIIHRSELPRESRVSGTVLNTLCNIMGAGVLALPYAMYTGSILIATILLVVSVILSAFSVFAVVYACDVTGKYSYTEMMSYSCFPSEKTPLIGPSSPSRSHTPHDTGGGDDGQNNNTSNNNNAVDSTNNNDDSSGSRKDVDTESITELNDDEGDDEDEGFYTPGHETDVHRHRRITTVLLEFVVFLNGFGTVAVYSRVIRDSVPPVLKKFFGASGGVVVEPWFWVVVPAVVFFALSCIRTMDELKWTSLLGFATIMYVIIGVIVRYFTNIMNEKIAHEDAAANVEVARAALSCFSTVSTFALAFGFHYNLPYFYREMRDRRPNVIMKCVATAFPIIFVCYLCTGLLGYLTFGALVASSAAGGSIINNFSDDDIPMNVGRVLLVVHFISVYPILAISARRGIHRILCIIFYTPKLIDTRQEQGQMVDPNESPPGDPAATRISSIVLEAFVIVVLSSLVANYVSGIGTVVDLVGTLFGMPLLLTFPGIAGLCVFKEGVPAVSHLNLRWCRIGSWVNVVCGNIFLICGIIAFGFEVA